MVAAEAYRMALLCRGGEKALSSSTTKEVTPPSAATPTTIPTWFQSVPAPVGQQMPKRDRASSLRRSRLRNYARGDKSGSSSSESKIDSSSKSSDTNGHIRGITRNLHSKSTSPKYKSALRTRKGPRHDGLKALRSTDNVFTELVKYC